MSNQQENWKKKPLDFTRYSGVAFQIIAIVLLAVFGGQKLDNHFKTPFPYWTLGLSVLGIISSLYFMLKELLKKNKP